MNLGIANKKLFSIGFLALTIGATFYFVGRPEGASYFQEVFAEIDKFFPQLPSLFGRLGGSLPEFVHPFAFSLMGIGLFATTRIQRFWICFVFFSINALFELGQHYSAFITSCIPAWFNSIPLLKNTTNYFTLGTFSMVDLAAILVGSTMAFIVSELTLRPLEVSNEWI